MKYCPILLILLLFTSCTNFILDPCRRELTSCCPGELWDPDCDKWYCERKPYKPNFMLPECGHAHDISELLNIALSNHPETRLAWRQARAQAFAVGAAESTLYPTITGTESLVFNDFSNRAAAAAINNDSNNINSNTINPSINPSGAAVAAGSTYSQSILSELMISYLVLDFGGREASIQSTRYALQALNWTQNRVIQQVIFNVMQSYYGYINAKETIKAREEDLKNALTNLEASEVLFQAGLVRKLDVLLAQSNAENAKLALVSAKSQIQIAQGTLATALGIPATDKVEVKDLPEKFPIAEITTSVEDLMETARRNRPDLASAYATILQRRSDYQVAVSNALPNITADVFMQNVEFLHRTGVNGNNFSGVVSLNIPIFSGFLYANQIKEAKENIKAAEANFQNLEIQALQDVVTGYYNFISAKESIQFSEKYLEYSQEGYDLALGIYKNGTGTILDVLTALSQLETARINLINARTTWATSLFNLAYITGTLDTWFVEEELNSCTENSTEEHV